MQIDLNQNSILMDDKGRQVKISIHGKVYYVEVDGRIGIHYRDKKKLLRDLRSMSKTYKEVSF